MPIRARTDVMGWPHGNADLSGPGTKPWVKMGLHGPRTSSIHADRGEVEEFLVIEDSQLKGQWQMTYVVL